MSDERHMEELKQIFQCICEKLTTKKYGGEPNGTSAMKPFLNNENDRIICKPTKRKGKTQCIVMSELILTKKGEKIDKALNVRYKIVGGYNYEIIE